MQEHLAGNVETWKTFEIALVNHTKVRLRSEGIHWGGRLDAAIPTADAFGIHFVLGILQNQFKIYSVSHFQSDSEKTWKMMPNGFQFGAKMDVTNHQHQCENKYDEHHQQICFSDG